ncbi:hypothetical protein ACJ2A9_16940 [Anaerobacillus sp. MEB173]|uniref:hypothetical protein n=1 Tax=Anaerobacillus sp. MEB173 TaxID=3383345 RepID=UPI003F900612
MNEESNYIESISQNMVHLNDGTPDHVKEYFEKKIKEKDGGLHTFEFENKTFLMLLEPNRMISRIEEYDDYVRVITIHTNDYGTFNFENGINQIIYIYFIESLGKPFGIFRSEDIE